MYGHLWGGARKRWAKGKWAGFSSIHETPKRREPACMGIYEEVHGKDELKESGQDSAPYMRHPKQESLHVCSFMRRRTEKKTCTISHEKERHAWTRCMGIITWDSKRTAGGQKEEGGQTRSDHGAVAPELSLWTKSMPKRTQQDAKKSQEVRHCWWLMVIGVVVSHLLSMREALGSIPTWSITKETHGKDAKVGRIQLHTWDTQKERACMYGHLWGGARKRWAKGKWAGFSSIHETPKRREPACMGIYEEVHGKDELKESGQDSAPYMRHPKGESLHVWAFMRRCTEKMS